MGRQSGAKKIFFRKVWKFRKHLYLWQTKRNEDESKISTHAEGSAKAPEGFYASTRQHDKRCGRDRVVKAGAHTGHTPQTRLACNYC
jgi:murein L,D-transpeptidase YafK